MDAGMHGLGPLCRLLVEGAVKNRRTFTFQDLPELWVVFLVILPGVILFSYFVYRRESGEVPARGRYLLAGVRSGCFLLLFLFLFRPVILTERVREIKPLAVLLLDDSASMREHDRYADPETAEALRRAAGLASAAALRDLSRRELMERVLTRPEEDLLARLEDRYDLKYYAFADGTAPVGGLSDLTSEGESTRIGDALAEVVKQYRGRRLANILLVSDGRSNRGRDPEEGARLAAADQVPVYAVGVGDPAVSRNIAVEGVNAPSVVLVHDEVIFKVDLSSRGYEGRPVTILLKDKKDGALLARGDAELKGGGEVQQVLLYWQPQRAGEYTLQVEIPVEPDEQDGTDNVFTLFLRVESERIRVLYVDGYPRWEYRTLWTLLTRVENFEVQVWLQSADSDFVQESSPGVPPLARFPGELQELMKYHVILFGDVDPDRLAEDRERSRKVLENIKAFVEAGGGFLMQAGNLYSPAVYGDTPVADLLPVIPGNYAEERMRAQGLGEKPFRLALENPLDPPEVLRLEKEPVRNRRLWEDPEYGLAGFYWYYPVERAKTGAEVWARHPENRNRYGKHVIMASTYYPAGRTVFIGVDATWRWRFPYRDKYTDLFWRKMVRFLAQNKLRRKDYRYDLNTDRSRYNLNERVRITARVRDVDFRLSEKPFQTIKLMDPRARVTDLRLEKVEPGTYERTYIAPEPGTFQLWIEDESAPGGARQALTTFTVTIPRLEAENPVLDRAVLERTARISGGAYFGLHEMGRLVDALRDEKIVRPLSNPAREDLWSSWWALLLFTGFMAVEWILRKRWNLL